ncbi:hypothetical protein [Bacteriovorax sp. Seq25_V]|uniref:hypothetical protein n=1 Tax=Bacteriovorax sp. Seq25_V TaxID=1201288 RepID=UPI00038A0476|nr:hypothetical protein [Bacteriovorax sp. Seq25_V]EQC45367.1 hypothetical protein M900_2036 [Bacteriovorax sp. Seq25_V]
MEKLIAILSLTFSLSTLASPENIFCAYESAMKYKDLVEFPELARDKYKHCTISCIVGVECGVTSSAILGMAKEIADIFGAGTPEWEDLLADIVGLRISSRADVYDFVTCSNVCEIYY